jgi:lysozyme family protein
MADFKKYFPLLLKWEGGSEFTITPGDHGGPTKYGVTLNEWISSGYDKNGDGKIDVEDLKLITEDDASNIAKKQYWDVLKGDLINNQSFANLVIDFAYNCGSGTAARKVQIALGFDIKSIDGVIGNHTIDAINSFNQQDLFNKVKQLRIDYYNAIVQHNPTQQKFLKGWLARTNSFQFSA